MGMDMGVFFRPSGLVLFVLVSVPLNYIVAFTGRMFCGPVYLATWPDVFFKQCLLQWLFVSSCFVTDRIYPTESAHCCGCKSEQWCKVVRVLFCLSLSRARSFLQAQTARKDGSRFNKNAFKIFNNSCV